jgi:hypothetical protein
MRSNKRSTIATITFDQLRERSFAYLYLAHHYLIQPPDVTSVLNTDPLILKYSSLFTLLMPYQPSLETCLLRRYSLSRRNGYLRVLLPQFDLPQEVAEFSK